MVKTPFGHDVEIEGCSNKSRSPCFGFNSESRVKSCKSITPGPGAYTLGNFLG